MQSARYICAGHRHQRCEGRNHKPRCRTKRVRQSPALPAPVVDHRYYDAATGQFLSVDPLVGQTMEPYIYAGDDPINDSDASGLYDYTYIHDIGPPSEYGSPAQVMTVFQHDFKNIFPFEITDCGDVIVDGAVCELHVAPCWVPFVHGCGYVRVVNVTDTSFAFIVLPSATYCEPSVPVEGSGYFDPSASVITFSTYLRHSSGIEYYGPGQDVFLQQHGYAPNNHGLLDFLAPYLAVFTWNSQAENLKNAAFLAMHPGASPGSYGAPLPPTGLPPSGFPT